MLWQLGTCLGMERWGPIAGTRYGYFSAAAKFGQPPGWKYGQWDFRPQWDYYSEDDNELEVAFDRSMEGFQTGGQTPI